MGRGQNALECEELAGGPPAKASWPLPSGLGFCCRPGGPQPIPYNLKHSDLFPVASFCCRPLSQIGPSHSKHHGLTLDHHSPMRGC